MVLKILTTVLLLEAILLRVLEIARVTTSTQYHCNPQDHQQI